MKLVHAQTVIELDKLEKLKKLTGDNTTQGAIYEAIEFYLKRKGGKK